LVCNEKKKEITEGKIYSPVGNLAERAKLQNLVSDASGDFFDDCGVGVTVRRNVITLAKHLEFNTERRILRYTIQIIAPLA